jgi:hypothetical protein
MRSHCKSALLFVALITLAPAAFATCPTGPFSQCQPYSYTWTYYSDATKTTVGGVLSQSCPDVCNCQVHQTLSGEMSNYISVQCERCASGCGNCLPNGCASAVNQKGTAAVSLSLEVPSQELTGVAPITTMERRSFCRLR